MNSKRIFIWIGFIIVIALIIWGLIAAQSKNASQSASLALPDQITASDHIMGSATAPVTLVEYGDFECPACGQYYPVVQKLIADEGTSTVRYVFRHFPLPQHANAIPAAEASEAAANQGKFWDMFDLLYSNQKDWVDLTDATPIFLGYAKQINLNIPQFQADVAASSTAAIVNNSFAASENAGLNSTPSFFINGKQITNPQSYADFKKLIDAAASTTSNS